MERKEERRKVCSILFSCSFDLNFLGTTEKPSALTSVIYPAIDKLSDNAQDDRLVAALQHLKTTFDNAGTSNSL